MSGEGSFIGGWRKNTGHHYYNSVKSDNVVGSTTPGNKKGNGGTDGKETDFGDANPRAVDAKGRPPPSQVSPPSTEGHHNGGKEVGEKGGTSKRGITGETGEASDEFPAKKKGRGEGSGKG